MGAVREYFQDESALAVLGNGFEIGRSNNEPVRRKGVAAPATAETMAALHYRKIGSEVQENIETYGIERYMEASVCAFQAFINETGYSIVSGMLDPFDHFYWEHRMSTWQGVAMGERDFYAVPCIPFNSRRVFAALLGARFESRCQDAAVLRMIEMVDPTLLEFPVNPKRWPPEP